MLLTPPDVTQTRAPRAQETSERIPDGSTVDSLSSHVADAADVDPDGVRYARVLPVVLTTRTHANAAFTHSSANIGCRSARR